MSDGATPESVPSPASAAVGRVHIGAKPLSSYVGPIAVLDRRARLGELQAFLSRIEGDRAALASAAMRDTGMTRHYAFKEIGLAVSVGRRLIERYGEEAREAGSGRIVALNLPYNSTVLALVMSMTRAYLAGHGVIVRASSKLGGLAEILAEICRGSLSGVRFIELRGDDFFSASFQDDAVFAVNHYGGYSPELLGWLSSDAERTRKVLMFEGPANNPAIFASSADLERRVKGTLVASFTNAGQLCLSPKRFYAVRAVADDVREYLRQEASRLDAESTGSPYEDNVIGPLGDERLASDPANGFDVMIREALSSYGARPVYLREGGALESVEVRDPETSKVYRRILVHPTVIETLDHETPLLQNEKFGPVATLHVVDDVREAVAMSKASPYGLIATAFVDDADAGWVKAALAENHAHVLINQHFFDGFDFSGNWGGCGYSGRVGYPTETGYTFRSGASDNWALLCRPDPLLRAGAP